MSTLALYRTLVPEHADPVVVDTTIDTWLAMGARQHNSASFGLMYPEAMVWWAAHRIARLPGSGAPGGGADDVGTLIGQKDGDLSRTYASPSSGGAASAASSEAELGLTRYGQLYLEIRDTRSATAPSRIAP